MTYKTSSAIHSRPLYFAPPAKHLKELSKLYVKKPPMLVRNQRELHVDESILWHLGQRKHFALPEPPQRNLDLILRR